MMLLPQPYPRFTLLPAGIVFARDQRMLDIAVQQHDPDAVRFEREITIFEALAVQPDHMLLTAEHRCELIHDPALHADKDLLRLLRQLYHRHRIEPQTEQLV